MKTKNPTTRKSKHRKVLSQTKGMSRSRRASYRLAKQAVVKKLQYSYRDRRNKKRDFRRLWIVRMNAILKSSGYSYSTFAGKLAEKNIKLNRKILAHLAVSEPEVFKLIIKKVF